MRDAQNGIDATFHLQLLKGRFLCLQHTFKQYGIQHFIGIQFRKPCY